MAGAGEASVTWLLELAVLDRRLATHPHCHAKTELYEGVSEEHSALSRVLMTWSSQQVSTSPEENIFFHQQGLNWGMDEQGILEVSQVQGQPNFMGGLETSYFPFTLVLTLLPVFRSD